MNSLGLSQAVILAAGRGSRMGELSAQQPKCLCPLAGQPILAWTIEALRTNGIQAILVIAGWQCERLAGWGDQVRINPHWASGNMVRSLQLASDWLAQAPTLVVYGDGAYGVRAISAALHGPCNDLVVPVDRRWLSLWRRRFANPLDDAETLTVDNGRLTGIGERTRRLQDIEGQFMGLLRITPTGWTRVTQWLDKYAFERGSAAVDRLDMTGLLQGLIADKETVHCVDVDGGWVEIDSPHDCAVVERSLSDPEFLHDFRR